MYYLINRPGEAGAVLQTPLLLIEMISSLINWVTESSFVKISSKHLHSQTFRDMDLTFWESVHLTQRVTCHMSCVMCHVSCVMCHVSCVMCHMLHFYLFLNIFFYCRQSGGSSRRRVCYQRGLPCLVYKDSPKIWQRMKRRRKKAWFVSV